MQWDGNLVLYEGKKPRPGGLKWKNPDIEKAFKENPGFSPDGVMKPIWNSGTHGKGARYVSMQGDGNLVIYGDKGPIWASNTAGHPGARLTVHSEGYVCIVHNKEIIWWAPPEALGTTPGNPSAHHTSVTPVSALLPEGPSPTDGSPQTSDGKAARSELEVLRRENELLKVNLQTVLENVRGLSEEVRALKAQSNNDRAKQNHGASKGYEQDASATTPRRPSDGTSSRKLLLDRFKDQQVELVIEPVLPMTPSANLGGAGLRRMKAPEEIHILMAMQESPLIDIEKPRANDLAAEGDRLQSEDKRLKSQEVQLDQTGKALQARAEALRQEDGRLDTEQQRLGKVREDLIAEQGQVRHDKDQLEAYFQADQTAINNDITEYSKKAKTYKERADDYLKGFKYAAENGWGVDDRRCGVEYYNHLARTGELIEGAPRWIGNLSPRREEERAHWTRDAQAFNALCRDVRQRKRAIEDHVARSRAKGEEDSHRLRERVQAFNDRASTFERDGAAFSRRVEAFRAALKELKEQSADWQDRRRALVKQRAEWAKDYDGYLEKLRERPALVVRGPRQWVVFYAHDQMHIGHAFVAWIQEDEKQSATIVRAMGFYPGAGALPDPIPSDLGEFTTLIAGGQVPGEILDEYKRWNKESKAYLSVPVSREVFNRSQAVMKDWKDKPYRLHSKPQNCIDFVAQVARVCGLKLPVRSEFTFPVDYARKLKELNQ
jgi:hypothetical protein